MVSRRGVPRNFAGGGAGVLLLVLFGVAVGSADSGICGDRIPYALPSLASMALIACMWEAHVRVRKQEVKSFLLRVLHNLLFLVMVGGLPWLLFVVSAHALTCSTPRSRASELVLAGSSARTALSEGMQTYGSFAPKWMESVTIPATGQVRYAHIFPDGHITLIGKDPQVVVVMTPTLTTDNKLVWTCTGEPKKYMPASCRDN